MKKILVTGGAGYIGSHTLIELAKNRYEVVVVDNLCNSSRTALKRVEQITQKTIKFYEVDCRDKNALNTIFEAHHFDAIIHFAGLKAVGESVKEPLRYYQNNLDSLLCLCEVMQNKGVRQLVFSSSATTYGAPQELPLKEDSPKGPLTNPYGRTKAMAEQILQDLAAADSSWKITILRYFNPIGAHESGLIGEDPNGIPNNIFPGITQVAIGKRSQFKILGNDYDTSDGTGVRDYIHVGDLAEGHVAALNHPAKGGEAAIYNLGTGKGTSVLELIHSFERVTGVPVPFSIEERRPGDIATCYADPSQAKLKLKWQAKRTIDDACRDAWRWQSGNPNGYN